MRIVVAVAMAAALWAAAAPAAQGATVFGAGFNVANIDQRVSEGMFRCTGFNLKNVVGLITFPNGWTNCTAFTAGVFGSGAGGHVVPAGVGVITSVRVRQGPVTGPLKISILSMQRLGVTPGMCCSGKAESGVFTPAPNQTTELQTRFPVRNERTFTGVEETDQIALTGVNETSRIPAIDAGVDPSTEIPILTGGVYFPAFAPGQERNGAAVWGTTLQIMLQATWEPDADGDGFGDETQDRCPTDAKITGVARAAACPAAPAPGGGPGTGGGPAITPRLLLGRVGTDSRRRGTMLVTMPMAGKLSVAGFGASKRYVRSASITSTKKRKVRVTVAPTAAALAVLRRRALTVRAKLTFKPRTGRAVTSYVKYTFKRR